MLRLNTPRAAGSRADGVKMLIAVGRVAVVVLLVSVVSSCGLLDGKGSGSAARDCGSAGPEKTDLDVSIMETTDLAPFHLAVQEGFFAEECLTVDFTTAAKSDDSVRKLPSGEADIAYASYPPFFIAEAQGVARDRGGIKLIADASSAGPDSCVVVALPGSRVKSMKDMGRPGIRVAVTSPASIGTGLTKTTLKANGIEHENIEWVSTPFPLTSQALLRGDVDAAFVTEPFISETHENTAVTIFDTAKGPTNNFPTAGWGATGDFVKENPNTVAGFQRAMQKGTNLALSDRSLVEPLLVKYSKVDKQIAKVATLLTFQSRLDASRIQRVPEMMLEYPDFYGVTAEIDVSRMIVPTAPLD